MFEKAKSLQAPQGASARTFAVDERFAGGAGGRAGQHGGQRAGNALRSVEWSELTARLNAARDLRLLLRNESQAPIEAVAASFGDAAASYFALLDDSEPAVNRDALEHLKDLGAKVSADQANRPGQTEGHNSDAPRGEARDTK